MTYPITIVDNFFEDPDAIVEMAMGMKYAVYNFLGNRGSVPLCNFKCTEKKSIQIT